MKIIFAADLHGIERLYEQLFLLVSGNRPDAVLLGGDLLPKEGPFEESMEEQRHFVVRCLEPKLLEIRSLFPATEWFVMLGNEDWFYHIALFQDMEFRGLVKLIHNRRHVLRNSLEVIGYSHVPPTPFSNKDGERRDLPDVPETPQQFLPCLSTKAGLRYIRRESYFRAQPTLWEELEALPRPSDPGKAVYVMHSPPWETNLDVLHDGSHAGSRAIRRFIEERQPLLTLHGHIHESPFVSGNFTDRIGSTLCMNPGHASERLSAIVLEGGAEGFIYRHTILETPAPLP